MNNEQKKISIHTIDGMDYLRHSHAIENLTIEATITSNCTTVCSASRLLIRYNKWIPPSKDNGVFRQNINTYNKLVNSMIFNCRRWKSLALD